MESSCLVALIIALLADFLEVVAVRNSYLGFSSKNDSPQSFFDQWKTLDPEFLEETFAYRGRNNGLLNLSSLMNALSLFVLVVPIIQVSWILSQGGRQHLGLHAAVFLFAMAAAICKLVVSLMMIGTRGSFKFIEERFEVGDWELQTSNGNDNGDGVGWRVLEMIHIIIEGMTTWMTAFEWICIFFIMTILFFAVRSQNKSFENPKVTFGRKWSFLGLGIGILGLFEFIANIMKLHSWVYYSRISLMILALNTLVLLPIWLFVLGRQLPAIRASFENKWAEQEEDKLLNQAASPDVI